MSHQRVAKQSDKIAAAAGSAQLGADEEQIGQRVFEEVLVVAAADVNLDGEPEIINPARRGDERVEPVCDHLELQLVEPVDEGEEVEMPQLCVALQYRAQSRPRRFLDVVEEDDRAFWQGRLAGRLRQVTGPTGDGRRCC